MMPLVWPPQELHVQLTILKDPQTQRPGMETGWLKPRVCVWGGCTQLLTPRTGLKFNLQNLHQKARHGLARWLRQEKACAVQAR